MTSPLLITLPLTSDFVAAEPHEKEKVFQWLNSEEAYFFKVEINDMTLYYEHYFPLSRTMKLPNLNGVSIGDDIIYDLKEYNHYLEGIKDE